MTVTPNPCCRGRRSREVGVGGGAGGGGAGGGEGGGISIRPPLFEAK